LTAYWLALRKSAPFIHGIRVVRGDLLVTEQRFREPMPPVGPNNESFEGVASLSAGPG
jgi:hypothetical protein